MQGAIPVTHKWGKEDKCGLCDAYSCKTGLTFKTGLCSQLTHVCIQLQLIIQVLAGYIQLLALLSSCSVVMEYVLHNGVKVKSHGVVLHDYFCRVEEHLKSHLDANNKSKDWFTTKVVSCVSKCMNKTGSLL